MPSDAKAFFGSFLGSKKNSTIKKEKGIVSIGHCEQGTSTAIPQNLSEDITHSQKQTPNNNLHRNIIPTHSENADVSI
ncbi:hypothetical protein [Sediminibacter sp. Hel_I_10]|uniref:hypothetical protein n=1 Tax=Sediminibacter sp. Hel_I_10 TaxID=1392490 RepID=UPI0012DCA8C2|nr:hypothetical protein [Sediminibacter sp. Hel_I_10]